MAAVAPRSTTCWASAAQDFGQRPGQTVVREKCARDPARRARGRAYHRRQVRVQIPPNVTRPLRRRPRLLSREPRRATADHPSRAASRPPQDDGESEPGSGIIVRFADAKRCTGWSRPGGLAIRFGQAAMMARAIAVQVRPATQWLRSCASRRRGARVRLYRARGCGGAPDAGEARGRQRQGVALPDARRGARDRGDGRPGGEGRRDARGRRGHEDGETCCAPSATAWSIDQGTARR